MAQGTARPVQAIHRSRGEVIDGLRAPREAARLGPQQLSRRQTAQQGRPEGHRPALAQAAAHLVAQRDQIDRQFGKGSVDGLIAAYRPAADTAPAE